MGSKLSETLIATIKSAAKKLSGPKKRLFQVEAARDYCKGSARAAERKFGWWRYAVQRGLDELEANETIPNEKRTGRPSYSQQLPNLQNDIRELVDPNSQTHPTFKTTFRYTRMTASAVLEALVKEKGYKKEELPAESSMSRILNKMNYRLRRVQKTKPQKKFPKQT
jgi:hypothetical protein